MDTFTRVRTRARLGKVSIALDKQPQIRSRTTKAKTKEKKVIGYTEWKNPGDACFIVKGSRIKFHYNSEDKDLKIRSGARASTLLVALTSGSLTQEEVKELICTPKTKPSDAIKNINKTLNHKIKSLGFNIPDNVKFIALEERNKQYYCSLPTNPSDEC